MNCRLFKNVKQQWNKHYTWCFVVYTLQQRIKKAHHTCHTNNVSLSLFSLTPWCFFPSQWRLGSIKGKWMQRWPFTAGKWSADLISGVQLSSLCSACCLCAACYIEMIPSYEETLRDDWWKGRGLPPVSSSLVSGDCSPPTSNFFFVC